MTKRFGFTLAEVLITLGIIGVVAAMSIPTLIANTNSAKFRSQFKKTVATLNQAALMSQAQYDYDFATGATIATKAASIDPNDAKKASIGSMLMGTLSGATVYDTLGALKYTNSAGTEVAYAVAQQKSGVTTKAKGLVTMADGSIFAFNNAAVAAGCSVTPGTRPNTYIPALVTAGCAGFIDVNGTKAPNAETVCKDGTADASTAPETPCAVPSDAAHTRDIFPVVYHDGVVEPATNAARAVLSTSK